MTFYIHFLTKYQLVTFCIAIAKINNTKLLLLRYSVCFHDIDLVYLLSRHIENLFTKKILFIYPL